MADSPAPARAAAADLSLADAAAAFVRRPTPWLLALAVAATWTWRATLGSWGWLDVAVAIGTVLAFPLQEWVLHTSLLHWRPRRVGRLTLDPLVAREHRAHHADPTDLQHVFIPLPALLTAAAALLAAGALVPGRWIVTFVAVQATLGLVYEWTHYLVHTTYRPRTAGYRAIWRHHRLHHYKNEHYWFTVTTTGTADRLLGTQPDPTQVPSSPTARNLHASGDRPAG